MIESQGAAGQSARHQLRPLAMPEPEPPGRMVHDRHVAVVGLGYVGLPLGLAFVEAGLTVQGIDTSPRRVAELREGRSPVGDIPDRRLQSGLAAGLAVLGPHEARLDEADSIFVCVPTPVDATAQPDLGPLLAAAETLAEFLRPGQLVVLQSTSFPGTTSGPFRQVLETSGLVAGRDFDLAFAPERVNPGDPASSGRAVPRLVGGTTPAATSRAARLLHAINDRVVEVSSPEVAEMAKLLENTFRTVNVGFVNEIALLCERMGLDAWEVIDAAATKPFGFMRFAPGPGVGGHCIPVDPHYLAWKAREHGFAGRYIETAMAVNAGMPRHVVDLAAEALNDRGLPLRGARVSVLGVAFKPNVGDARNSPAGPVLAGLMERGALVRYHDPHVPAFRDAALETELIGGELDGLLAGTDLVVILVAHDAIDWQRVFDVAPLVVDTVGVSRGRLLAPRQVLRLGAGWAS